MPFLPQEFLSNINNKDGLSKPSRFEVILPIPTYVASFISHSFLEELLNLPGNIISDVTSLLRGQNKDPQGISANPSISRYLGMQCESAELPGRVLQTLDAKVYGPTFKVPYTSQYSDMNMTFLCTNEFYERKLFDRWIEAIHPTDTYNLRFAKGEEGGGTRYLSNIKVVQYDDFIRQIFAVELMDAFPIGISSQPLSWSEEGFHRLTVQFAYQKYKVIYQGSYDIAQFALSIFGSAANKWIDQKTNKIAGAFGRLF
jgi:hypothetical protein